MILVWGRLGDAPVAAVLGALAEAGTPHCHIDDGALATMRWDVRLSRVPTGWIEIRGRRLDCTSICGVYLRPWPAAHPNEHGAASAILLALGSTLPCPVVNRPGAGRSNFSKPYQLGLIAQAGFDVPATLITSDAAAARAFLRRHGRLVYKSLSGVRSIVGTIGPGDESRLSKVGTGPVQLQAHVPGLDVRVHVVGRRWFACAVSSAAIDYRYPCGDGQAPTLTPFALPNVLGQRLVALTEAMGLLVSGIDLRLTPTGSWICFEVNPSPGFTFYEAATGHPIAEAIVGLLAGEAAPAPQREGELAAGAAGVAGAGAECEVLP